VKQVLLWDRKAEGGFPETKVLKQRLRDQIDPSRDLGHSDRHGKKKVDKEAAEAKPSTSDQSTETTEGISVKRNPDGTVCEDCR
jgi:hypothetical protein